MCICLYFFTTLQGYKLPFASYTDKAITSYGIDTYLLTSSVYHLNINACTMLAF